MIRTYKRKLILNNAQTERIERWIGACRTVYNLGLEIKIASWRNKQKSINKYDLMKQVTGLRAEYDWIKDVPAESLNCTIIRLDNTYNKFFKGSGFPKWANKRKYCSIQLPQKCGIIKISNNRIQLHKIGWLKMFKDAPISGIIKNVIIKKESAGYFACIQCDNVPNKFNSENQTIGLDMGLNKLYFDSNGNSVNNPRHFKSYERKLKIANRSLSRKKKFGSNWKKQVKRLAKLHGCIANLRQDFLHKESTKIAKANQTVIIEDLNIQGMVKNSRLAKSISDAGWGKFRAMLSYKTQVVAVNPKYTSQTCYECGTVDSKSRVSQSEFCCTSCGHISNADENAAKNILRKGIPFIRQRDAIACA